MQRRLILALDVPSRDEALGLARELKDDLAMVKVGLESYCAHGPDLVRALRDTGVEVFLDLKLHDIPRTVAAAAREACKAGATLLTVHAAGGPEMIEAARHAAPPETKVIAVTVLTSLNDGILRELGYFEPVEGAARRLGGLALEHGADGLVCSAHELAALLPLGGLRVVPGVRPRGAAVGDQKRVATPAQAVRAGATWIVVGRPILDAEDRHAAARAIVAEIAEVDRP